MNAPAPQIWELVADVRNTGRFSPETFDAQWLDGVTEPAVGARFRGHVKRSFEVLVGNRAVNNWHYEFTPTDHGTDVIESFWDPGPNDLAGHGFSRIFRKRRNLRDMRTTLERIKGVVEA